MIWPGGERQIGTHLGDIRYDHLARYAWVASRFGPGDRILDCACGVGYGANLISGVGATVTGVDYSRDAIDFANAHWQRGSSLTKFHCLDAQDLPADVADCDALVSFETLEHLEDPGKLLNRVSARWLYGSVPNEDAVPFDASRHRWHRRHYSMGDLPDLVKPFRLVDVLGQEDLETGIRGFHAGCMTIVFVAQRVD